LIESLGYSNKTLIEHLKALTDLGIMEEFMERTESAGRNVWVKYYLLSDLGRWFALLLTKEEALSKDEKAEIVRSVFRSYVRWVRELSEKLGVSKAILEEILTRKWNRQPFSWSPISVIKRFLMNAIAVPISVGVLYALKKGGIISI